MKNNEAIAHLIQTIHTINTLAPPPAQVEDAELIVIHEPNKTIRFLLPKGTRTTITNWARRKAKRQHTALREEATKLIKQHSQMLKMTEKRNQPKRRVPPTNVPTIVMDSGATSTCIREQDTKYVNKLKQDSPKTFLNANGTISKAGKKAELQYNMRQPAMDADMVPGLAMNSLLSTSKLADANYITVFTQDKVQVFDAETAKFHVEGKLVMKGWRCPNTGLWRVPIKPDFPNINTDTALLSKEATNIIENKQGRLTCKQRVRVTKSGASRGMVPCSGRLPNQIYLAQGD